MKRAIDLAVAVVGLLAATPFMTLVAALVVLDSPGPALFRQRRVGRGGRTFRIVKFRTMRSDASPAGVQLTRHDDARVTRVGRWLRRTKIDELPQLWNVLVGDMSLVGPRPEVPEYVALYPAAQRALVLSVRPGLTDLASLEFYDEGALFAGVTDVESFYVNSILPRKLVLYCDYAAHHSLGADMRVIARTLRAMVSGVRGATARRSTGPAS